MALRRRWRRTRPWARRRHAAPAAPRRHRRGRRERWCRRRGCGDLKTQPVVTGIPTFWREKYRKTQLWTRDFSIALDYCLGFNGFVSGNIYLSNTSDFLWFFSTTLQFWHCACCSARCKALGREAKTCSDLLGGDGVMWHQQQLWKNRGWG